MTSAMSALKAVGTAARPLHQPRKRDTGGGPILAPRRTTAEHPSIAGYILTKDCEATVGRAIGSVLAVASHVLVVDSGSTDGTREVARANGAEVVVHPFAGFPAQRNWALQRLSELFEPAYVLALDADEWLDAAAIDHLRHRAAAGTLDRDVYFIRRRIHFDGKVLRWGGSRATFLARLFRSGLTEYEDRQVNEHLAVPNNATRGVLEGAIQHADVASWAAYIDKHNRYSTLEAEERLKAVAQPTLRGISEALRRRDMRHRWLRERVWNHLPARPALRFVQVYVAFGGFLDGTPGFRKAVFEAWQEMCTDLKAEQLTPGGDEFAPAMGRRPAE